MTVAAFVAAWAAGPAALATAHRAMANGLGAAARRILGPAAGVTLWGAAGVEPILLGVAR